MPHVDIGDDRPRLPHSTPTAYPGITAFVSQAASWPADHPTAVAAREAGVRTVALQWEDPATDEKNVFECASGWETKWQQQGVKSSDWWRVEHDFEALYPIANAESDAEVDEIPYLVGEVIRAVFTLGKRPGVPIPLLNQRGITLFIECFRESAASDQTISNCWAWWEQAGMNMQLVRPCLQAYGVPFSSLGEQAAEAKQCGAAGIAVFPSELVSVDGWRQIGKAWA